MPSILTLRLMPPRVRSRLARPRLQASQAFRLQAPGLRGAGALFALITDQLTKPTGAKKDRQKRAPRFRTATGALARSDGGVLSAGCGEPD